MNLTSFIGRRYLFSSKSKTVINLISIISVVVVAVVTISLLIVLSGFNGLDSLVKNLFTTFDSDLTIKPLKGKSFEVNQTLSDVLKELKDDIAYTEVIEDNALIKYNERQMVVTVKGVAPEYLKNHSIDSAVVIGDNILEKDSMQYAFIGLGIHNILTIPSKNHLYPVQFIYPKNIKFNGIPNPKMLNIKNLQYGGTFAIEKQYDEQYAFVPLSFAAELTGLKDKRTAIEINLKDITKLPVIKEKIAASMSEGLEILESKDLHQSLFKAHNLEKLFVNLIFIFILVIASLNIFFALMMLIMEKRKDIAILKTMGLSEQNIKWIFLKNGFLISGLGTIIGLVLGYSVLYLQITYGLVSMGMESGLVDAYPVEMRWVDFIFVLVIVFLSTLLVSYWPARRASKIRINDFV